METTTPDLTINLPEINILYKAFYTLKFKGDEELLQEIVESPFFNSLFRRAADLLNSEYSKIGNINNDRFIENRPRDLSIIKEYLKNIEGFHALEENIKISIIENILSPFHYKEKTVLELAKILNP